MAPQPRGGAIGAELLELVPLGVAASEFVAVNHLPKGFRKWEAINWIEMMIEDTSIPPPIAVHRPIKRETTSIIITFSTCAHADAFVRHHYVPVHDEMGNPLPITGASTFEARLVTGGIHHRFVMNIQPDVPWDTQEDEGTDPGQQDPQHMKLAGKDDLSKIGSGKQLQAHTAISKEGQSSTQGGASDSNRSANGATAGKSPEGGSGKGVVRPPPGPSPEQKDALLKRIKRFRSETAQEPFTDEHEAELEKLLTEHMNVVDPERLTGNLQGDSLVRLRHLLGRKQQGPGTPALVQLMVARRLVDRLLAKLTDSCVNGGPALDVDEHRTLLSALHKIERPMPPAADLGLLDPPSGLNDWASHHGSRESDTYPEGLRSWVWKVRTYRMHYKTHYEFVFQGGEPVSAENLKDLSVIHEEIQKVDWTKSTGQEVSGHNGEDLTLLHVPNNKETGTDIHAKDATSKNDKDKSQAKGDTKVMNTQLKANEKKQRPTQTNNKKGKNQGAAAAGGNDEDSEEDHSGSPNAVAYGPQQMDTTL